MNIENIYFKLPRYIDVLTQDTRQPIDMVRVERDRDYMETMSRAIVFLNEFREFCATHQSRTNAQHREIVRLSVERVRDQERIKALTMFDNMPYMEALSRLVCELIKLFNRFMNETFKGKPYSVLPV
jgi:hypothetical protein